MASPNPVPPPPDDTVKRSVGVDWDDYQRLHALKRRIAATENKDLSLGATVKWMLDRIDVLDLP